MNSVKNYSSLSRVIPDSSAANRSHPQSCSARTPGEGYPFPRIPRCLGNVTPSATQSSSELPPSPAAARHTAPSLASPKPQIIDMDVFKQLLAMEDDDEKSSFSFTNGLIELYYEDGNRTVEQMRNALQHRDYTALARLAHFLRGSAASVGIIQVAKICEIIEMSIISDQKMQTNEWFEFQLQGIDHGHMSSRQWFRDFYAKRGVP